VILRRSREETLKSYVIKKRKTENGFLWLGLGELGVF
jgi:hypothetical protein